MTAWVRRNPELLAILAVVPVIAWLPGHIPLGIYAIGVVQGAVYALYAAGMVLVFRSNRFLNFAQVAIGAVAGTLFAVLVNAQPMLRATAPCARRASSGSPARP